MRQQLDRLVRTNQPENVAACGYQQLTVTGGTAQSLTVPSGARYAEVSVESATLTGFIMRYLCLGDTTPPTTTAGMPLAYGTVFDLGTSDAVNRFRVIAVSGSHTLNIQYYK